MSNTSMRLEVVAHFGKKLPVASKGENALDTSTSLISFVPLLLCCVAEEPLDFVGAVLFWGSSF